ncbi:NEDD4 family-interacting protein 1-like [Artemia franciscana]|uniref:NEDD4 family-interacting protein 1-like n=1 Tax=Artemia franciscana TaxID=6661 RepID=A0AA88L261_ARTSF|nr:hypothetical protein QYM36_010674 [Artemia franciscana]KAK2716174.1 hypothetical protein QYM36_010674 [Artemia franciscana]
MQTNGPNPPSATDERADQNLNNLNDAPMGIAPPAYDELMEGAVPKNEMSAPPAYEESTVLPSYDQVAREKAQEVQQNVNMDGEPRAVRSSAVTVFSVDSNAPRRPNSDMVLGTDFIFLLAFLVTFLFNWVGFLLCTCVCQSIAGRYGALSGLGLSLVKWALIVKQHTDLISDENRWLWYLLLMLGLTLCIRATVIYQCIKTAWHRRERVILYA